MTAQAPGQPPLPLRDVRKLLPGYSVRYQPREAQGGEVALLVAGAASQEFLVLPQKPATAEASWTLPVRASLVAVVYGPGGLDRKKVGQLVKRDPGLVSQLADYAEQTAQTEAIIERLTSPRTPASATWDAALAGFATRYGVPATALDPRAPFEQQAHVLLRAINPALSSYDPLQPEPRLRMQQSAGLAASVAGLFFGNSVGLAAGGASLLLNLRSLLLPNTEFRSSFAQLDPHSPAVVSLCAKREAARSRTRMAYLWAHRLVDSDAPALSLGGLAAVPAGVKSALPLTADDDQLAALLRDWQLERIDGSTSVAVPVRLAPDTRRAEIDLSQVTLAPGAFRLTAAWDWTRVAVDGVLQVEEIPRNFDVKGALVAGGENRISLAAPTLRYLESVSLKAGQTEFAGSWDGGVVRWSARSEER
ncbi:MAG TPA: hypothetical protein DEH78_32765, partial [Solibacterales bacterium]|nr:hypothetical protein [Bryobacterales bacterium]